MKHKQINMFFLALNFRLLVFLQTIVLSMQKGHKRHGLEYSLSISDH